MLGFRNGWSTAACVLAALAASTPAVGAPPDRPGTEHLGVGVDEKLDGELPLDLRFQDDFGRVVRLGEYFDGELPVVLTLNYSNCPMLCNLQLGGLMQGLRDVDLVPGRDFEVVSVSIDPQETVSEARRTKDRYVEEYGRSNAGGFHFLVGAPAAIESVADAVGFRYKQDPKTGEFNHPAVVMMCTPDGHIARYLYGIEFPPQTIRLSLLEAAEGKVSLSTSDRVLLFCLRYDTELGAYSLAARRVMTAGGVLTVLLLASFLVPYWLRERARAAQVEHAAAP